LPLRTRAAAASPAKLPDHRVSWCESQRPLPPIGPWVPPLLCAALPVNLRWIENRTVLRIEYRWGQRGAAELYGNDGTGNELTVDHGGRVSARLKSSMSFARQPITPHFSAEPIPSRQNQAHSVHPLSSSAPAAKPPVGRGLVGQPGAFPGPATSPPPALIGPVHRSPRWKSDSNFFAARLSPGLSSVRRSSARIRQFRRRAGDGLRVRQAAPPLDNSRRTLKTLEIGTPSAEDIAPSLFEKTLQRVAPGSRF